MSKSGSARRGAGKRASVAAGEVAKSTKQKKVGAGAEVVEEACAGTEAVERGRGAREARGATSGKDSSGSRDASTQPISFRLSTPDGAVEIADADVNADSGADVAQNVGAEVVEPERAGAEGGEEAKVPAKRVTKRGLNARGGVKKASGNQYSKPCVLCKKVAGRRGCIGRELVGQKVYDIVGRNLDKRGGVAGVKWRERIGVYDKTQTFARGDRLCIKCGNEMRYFLRAWKDYLRENVNIDKTNLHAFRVWVFDENGGKLPCELDKANIDGWDFSNAKKSTATVNVGKWWHMLKSDSKQATERRARIFKRYPEARKIFEELLKCESRVEHARNLITARNLEAFQRWVFDENDGKLPCARDKANIVGWDLSYTKKSSDSVKIGKWWRLLKSDSNEATERRARIFEHDPEARKIFEELLKCKPRERGVEP